MHVGHIKYLEQAKSYGDILILGLNSDHSTQRLKGKNRPINTQDDRAYILASVEVVDYVVIFNEDTPIDLIKLIKPDVIVKLGKGATFSVSVTRVELQVPLNAIRPKVESVKIVPAGKL